MPSRIAFAWPSCLLCASCATTEAIIDAPVEFWITLERIVMAMGTDLESVLWILGL
jgi:hypothetical protein